MKNTLLPHEFEVVLEILVSLKLPLMPKPLRDFIDLVWEIMEYRSSIDWFLFAVTAWSLWNNRNTVTHGRQSKGQEMLIRNVVEYVNEVKQENQSQTRVPPSPLATHLWSPLK